MNYFDCDSCFNAFNTNNNVSKDTVKIIMIINKLKLEIEITHARMKKQVNLLKEHVLNRNFVEDEYDVKRQNILLFIENLKEELLIRNAMIREKIELLETLIL